MDNTQNDTVFTKIIKGEIPCHKVYEDEKTLAFLDIHPVQPGMVLVITKSQVANFYELAEAEAAALWHTVDLVAKRLHEVFPEKLKIAVQVEGLEVEHAHVKLFPITTTQEFHTVADETLEPDHAALAEMAKKLSF